MPGVCAVISAFRFWPNAAGAIARCLLAASLIFPGTTLIATAGEADPAFPVRGIVRSLDEATLSTHIRARVTAIRFREGESFAKGDILVEFDCRTQRARMHAARAVRKERAVALKSAQYLQRMKAGSQQDVEIAEAQVEQADAEIEAIAASLEGCVLEAPHAGRVNQTFVRRNELPAEGSPIISIVDPTNCEIELIVTSNRIAEMKPGRRFTFRIDETGETHDAEVVRTSPVVDPVSQTVRIYGRFMQAGAAVLPGMSGEAQFRQEWALR